MSPLSAASLTEKSPKKEVDFFGKAEARIALATSVHNEEQFLEPHLRYHSLAGVSRYYIYLDRCTDGSREILSRHSIVSLIPDDSELLEPRPQHALRQMIVMQRAMAMAVKEGFDWLLFLDVDEFVFAGNPVSLCAATLTEGQRLFHQASLIPLLALQPPSVRQVVLRPKELIPTAFGSQPTPLHRLRYFTAPNLGLQRTVQHPWTGKRHRIKGLLGHKLGKSIVRVSGEHDPVTPHQWGKKGAGKNNVSFRDDEVRTEGCLYHYLLTSREVWRKKYAKHSTYSPVWAGGKPVEYFKQSSKELAASCDDREADLWLREIVITNRWILWKWLLLGRIVKDPTMSRLLERALKGREDLTGHNNLSDTGNPL